MHALIVALLLVGDPTDWQKAEAEHLSNIRPVTKDFARAGEGYFSPDGKQIIFQAEEKDSGNPFYQIFVMDLDSGKFRRVSPGVGKTTCSFFRPDGKKIAVPAGGATTSGISTPGWTSTRPTPTARD